MSARAHPWSRLLAAAFALSLVASMAHAAPEEPAREELQTEAIPGEDQKEEVKPEEQKEEAKPEAQKNETDDEAFAKGFIGKTYARELEIEGWADLGGGLVLPPIYVHQYQREDGTFLVLTSRELTPPTGTSPATYEVADALVVSPPQPGAEFTIACVQGEDETLRFMGEARGKEDSEWWTDVRRAWEISLETGKITEAKTRGVRCTNISWGQ